MELVFFSRTIFLKTGSIYQHIAKTLKNCQHFCKQIHLDKTLRIQVGDVLIMVPTAAMSYAQQKELE